MDTSSAPFHTNDKAPAASRRSTWLAGGAALLVAAGCAVALLSSAGPVPEAAGAASPKFVNPQMSHARGSLTSARHAVAPRTAAAGGARGPMLPNSIAPRANRMVTMAAASAASPMTDLPASVKPGVVTGQALQDLLQYAQDKGFAIPGVNIVGTNSINACLEAAAKAGGPIMVTFSRGGGQFIAGKTASNEDDAASIAGAVAGALHVRTIAKLYGIPVILHTDHCSKAWLPWFDGMIAANEEYFEKHGEPLFSSHMLDLSEEPLEENIAICKKYLERMAKIDVTLEMELGITGGEEDGVDNTDVDSSKLYTQPEEVWQVYETLAAVPNGHFTVAAAFGNVHGVYSPGNVKLEPQILHNTQKYISEKLGLAEGSKPVKFVFHGGSGSSLEDIRYAIDAGVIKMNIDTDTQWAFWDGIRAYEAKNRDYLQGQIGNPDGAEKPNKKYYDPRMSLREGEMYMADRLVKAMEDLKCIDVVPVTV